MEIIVIRKIATGEILVRNCLHFFMMGCGFNVIAEAHTANGRTDLRIDFYKRRLVFEFKYGTGNANCATLLTTTVTQMQNNNYGDVMPKKDETICIALVFDSKEKKFTYWQKV